MRAVRCAGLEDCTGADLRPNPGAPTFWILFVYFFSERGREGERERNASQLPLICAPTGDGTHNPGLCPDQESKWWPFTLWDEAQPTT